MYAVIRTGGKQYRVQAGDVLRVEKLDVEVGKNVNFDVLLVGEGSDIKTGADAAATSVTGVVTGEGRGKKVVIFKKRRRKNYRLTKGHRQDYTQVEITEVGGKAAAKKAAPKAAAKAKAEPKAEAVEKKAAPKKAVAEKKEAAPKAAAKKEAAPKAEATEKKAPGKKAAPKKAAAEKKEAAPKTAAKKTAAKATKADKE